MNHSEFLISLLCLCPHECIGIQNFPEEGRTAYKIYPTYKKTIADEEGKTLKDHPSFEIIVDENKKWIDSEIILPKVKVDMCE